MRLQDKFKKVFILPLICGILISIVLTVIILILYARQFADDDLVKRFQTVENDKTLPIIQTTKNMLYKKFQQSVYSIELFSNYYTFFAEHLGEKINDDLIKNYSINSIVLADNYNISQISKDNNSTYLGILLS